MVFVMIPAVYFNVYLNKIRFLREKAIKYY